MYEFLGVVAIIAVIIGLGRLLGDLIATVVPPWVCFWLGLALALLTSWIVFENIGEFGVANEGYLMAALIAYPHYILILIPSFFMSIKERDFLHGLSEEIGHYMFVVSLFFFIGYAVLTGYLWR